MNPYQFTTKTQAEAVLALLSTLTYGGSIFIPEYAGPFQVPNGDVKFYHVHLNNGFVCNAGLVAQNMIKYGDSQALQFAAAEMKAEGRWVA